MVTPQPLLVRQGTLTVVKMKTAITLCAMSPKGQAVYMMSSCLPATYCVIRTGCVLQVRMLRFTHTDFLVICLVSQQSQGVVQSVSLSQVLGFQCLV